MAIRDIAMAAAGALGGGPTYIEDIFSTYLYTGTGSTQTITNGIDLAGEGGMVWIKNRGSITNNMLQDSERGTNFLFSDLTNAQVDYGANAHTFNSDGFTINGANIQFNQSGVAQASWTFRKAPKFFDVVTYTGDGTTGRNIAHNLGSVPGCIIVKRTDSSSGGDWTVYHQSLSSNTFLYLNATLSEQSGGQYVFGDNTNIITPTSSDFTISAGAGYANVNGATYVAYLFAHNAGGFGDDGLQDIISCGSYTTDGSADAVVTLGYEPQWLLVKCSDTAATNWVVLDNMRGIAAGVGGGTANDAMLFPNGNYAESVQAAIELTATGFHVKSNANIANGGQTYIYIAIRRPMKTPASGSEVFAIDQGDSTGSANPPQMVSGFPVDWALTRDVTATGNMYAGTRLTQGTYLQTNLPNAEASSANYVFDYMNGWYDANLGSQFYSWMFKRAPGFFDVVCYRGNGVSGTTQAHNLGTTPELAITKVRTDIVDWAVAANITATTFDDLRLNQTYAATNRLYTASSGFRGFSSSTFTVGSSNLVNANGYTYVTYLFASCPGVSKVGSYTGNGTSQTIDCGFSAGARFVLIKRTDSTGDWYVWDSARGITASNDPHLSLNTTAAEVTTDDSVDADATGFIVNQVVATNVNVSSATYIFLSIA